GPPRRRLLRVRADAEQPARRVAQRVHVAGFAGHLAAGSPLVGELLRCPETVFGELRRIVVGRSDQSDQRDAAALLVNDTDLRQPGRNRGHGHAHDRDPLPFATRWGPGSANLPPLLIDGGRRCLSRRTEEAKLLPARVRHAGSSSASSPHRAQATTAAAPRTVAAARAMPARQAVTGRQLVASCRAAPRSLASSAVSSTTSRPPPSSGTRITRPLPSFVTSRGPSPVRGFMAAIACSLRLNHVTGSPAAHGLCRVCALFSPIADLAFHWR